MDRLYSHIVTQHLMQERQMIFLSGPRQVGKTTIADTTQKLTDRFLYLNWDDLEHREIILQGTSAIVALLRLDEVSTQQPILVLDEIHKHPDWKNFLKGLYDRFSKQIYIIVTGSSRLDIYKKGGDSLMGRYFPYRVHPLSVGELLLQNPNGLIQPPQELKQTLFDQLFEFGGFPDPFLRHNSRFSLRWQRLRFQQLMREDIHDVNALVDIKRLELLANLLSKQPAAEMTYASLAKKIRASVDTVSRWVDLLEAFYFCFLIRPWSQNVTRSLLKEPKVFLWDWSIIQDPGAKAENFIASHLLKATQYWTDLGFGNFGLYYLRDLDKREVDFVVTRDEKPWFLVEVKLSHNSGLNPNLAYFQAQIQAPHAFQVVIDKPFIDQNCFDYKVPVIVPALTLLSQLI